MNMEFDETSNSSGQPLFHLRRIGPQPTKPGVSNIMDFYELSCIIGRSSVQADFIIDSDVYMQGNSISRCHARVVRQPGNQHRLFDDSLNGIFVNNIKIRGSCVLEEGDKVTFGHPAGSKLQPGTWLKQPNSEHQFVFEKCSCINRNEDKKKTTQECPSKGEGTAEENIGGQKDQNNSKMDNSFEVNAECILKDLIEIKNLLNNAITRKGCSTLSAGSMSAPITEAKEDTRSPIKKDEFSTCMNAEVQTANDLEDKESPNKGKLLGKHSSPIRDKVVCHSSPFKDACAQTDSAAWQNKSPVKIIAVQTKYAKNMEKSSKYDEKPDPLKNSETDVHHAKERSKLIIFEDKNDVKTDSMNTNCVIGPPLNHQSESYHKIELQCYESISNLTSSEGSSEEVLKLYNGKIDITERIDHSAACSEPQFERPSLGKDKEDSERTNEIQVSDKENNLSRDLKEYPMEIEEYSSQNEEIDFEIGYIKDKLNQLDEMILNSCCSPVEQNDSNRLDDDYFSINENKAYVYNEASPNTSCVHEQSLLLLEDSKVISTAEQKISSENRDVITSNSEKEKLSAEKMEGIEIDHKNSSQEHVVKNLFVDNNSMANKKNCKEENDLIDGDKQQHMVVCESDVKNSEEIEMYRLRRSWSEEFDYKPEKDVENKIGSNDLDWRTKPDDILEKESVESNEDLSTSTFKENILNNCSHELKVVENEIKSEKSQLENIVENQLDDVKIEKLTNITPLEESSLEKCNEMDITKDEAIATEKKYGMKRKFSDTSLDVPAQTKIRIKEQTFNEPAEVRSSPEVPQNGFNNLKSIFKNIVSKFFKFPKKRRHSYSLEAPSQGPVYLEDKEGNYRKFVLNVPESPPRDKQESCCQKLQSDEDFVLIYDRKAQVKHRQNTCTIDDHYNTTDSKNATGQVGLEIDKSTEDSKRRIHEIDNAKKAGCQNSMNKQKDVNKREECLQNEMQSTEHLSRIHNNDEKSLLFNSSEENNDSESIDSESDDDDIMNTQWQNDSYSDHLNICEQNIITLDSDNEIDRNKFKVEIADMNKDSVCCEDSLEDVEVKSKSVSHSQCVSENLDCNLRYKCTESTTSIRGINAVSNKDVPSIAKNSYLDTISSEAESKEVTKLTKELIENSSEKSISISKVVYDTSMANKEDMSIADSYSGQKTHKIKVSENVIFDTKVCNTNMANIEDFSITDSDTGPKTYKINVSENAKPSIKENLSKHLVQDYEKYKVQTLYNSASCNNFSNVADCNVVHHENNGGNINQYDDTEKSKMDFPMFKAEVISGNKSNHGNKTVMDSVKGKEKSEELTLNMSAVFGSGDEDISDVKAIDSKNDGHNKERANMCDCDFVKTDLFKISSTIYDKNNVAKDTGNETLGPLMEIIKDTEKINEDKVITLNDSKIHMRSRNELEANKENGKNYSTVEDLWSYNNSLKPANKGYVTINNTTGHSKVSVQKAIISNPLVNDEDSRIDCMVHGHIDPKHKEIESETKLQIQYTYKGSEVDEKRNNSPLKLESDLNEGSEQDILKNSNIGACDIVKKETDIFELKEPASECASSIDDNDDVDNLDCEPGSLASFNQPTKLFPALNDIPDSDDETRSPVYIPNFYDEIKSSGGNEPPVDQLSCSFSDNDDTCFPDLDLSILNDTTEDEREIVYNGNESSDNREIDAIDISDKKGDVEEDDVAQNNAEVVKREQSGAEYMDNEKCNADLFDYEQNDAKVIDNEQGIFDVRRNKKNDAKAIDGEQKTFDNMKKEQRVDIDMKKEHCYHEVIKNEQSDDESVNDEHGDAEVMNNDNGNIEVVESEHSDAEVMNNEQSDDESINIRHSNFEVINNNHPDAEVVENEHIGAEVMQTEYSDAEEMMNTHSDAEVVESEHSDAEDSYSFDFDDPDFEFENVISSERNENETCNGQRNNIKTCYGHTPTRNGNNVPGIGKKRKSDSDDAEDSYLFDFDDPDFEFENVISSERNENETCNGQRNNIKTFYGHTPTRNGNNVPGIGKKRKSDSDDAEDSYSFDFDDPDFEFENVVSSERNENETCNGQRNNIKTFYGHTPTRNGNNVPGIGKKRKSDSDDAEDSYLFDFDDPDFEFENVISSERNENETCNGQRNNIKTCYGHTPTRNGNNVPGIGKKRKSDSDEFENKRLKSEQDRDLIERNADCKLLEEEPPSLSRNDDIPLTQLISKSTFPDLDCFTATQVDTVSEKLKNKVSSKSLEPETKQKARELLAKLKARRAVKLETIECKKEIDEPVGSTDLTSDVPKDREENHGVLKDIDSHVERCRGVISNLKQVLDSNQTLRRVQTWRNDLARIEKKLEFPKTVIAVVGKTGDGKSSLLNALLDQKSVLPTSCMQACTSVVVEIVQNTISDKFEADIQFLEEKEWYDEVKILLNDLTGTDGKLRKNQPDQTSDAYASYCKIKAVYGKINTFEKLRRQMLVTRWLGKIKVLKSSTPEEFKKMVEKYIETQDRSSGDQFWPIVKHVRLRIPNCNVCSSGAALVDLPGVRDSNAARDKIAKEYMKNCTAIWVVSSIHRAIDDKTAKDLLGENFRRQLLMDGQYGSVTFICTKTDILAPSELIRPLKLEDRTLEHSSKIKELEEEKKDAEKTVKSLSIELNELNETLQKMKQDADELKEQLEEIGSVLDPLELDKDDSEDFSVLREYQDELKSTEESIEQSQNKVVELDRFKTDASKKIFELENKISVHRKKISVICALARNRYSEERIKSDFRSGLKEMKRRAGISSNDDDDDDFEDLYLEDDDTSDNLKVFCCSSTEYQKIQSLLDDQPHVFTNAEDTQIPSLRRYVHQIARVRKNLGLERLIRSLGGFVFDLNSYVQESKHEDSTRWKTNQSAIEQEVEKLFEVLEPVIADLSSNITSVFDDNIKPKLDEGAAAAVEIANDICAKWGAKKPKDKENDKASTYLPYSTYKAVVSRNGDYSSKTFGYINFNEDLSEPMYRCMTIAWDRVFSGTLWRIIEDAKGKLVKKMIEFVEKLGTTLYRLGMNKDRLRRVGAQLLGSAKNKLEDMVIQLKEQITNTQRDISRLVNPHIQDSLTEPYYRSYCECGPGTYARIKDHMSKGIDHGRFNMFDEATKILMTQLMELQRCLINYVKAVCRSLIQDLRVSLEPLWNESWNSNPFSVAISPVLNTVCSEMRAIYVSAGIQNTEDHSDVVIDQETEPVCQSQIVDTAASGSNLNQAGPSTGTTQSKATTDSQSNGSTIINQSNRSILNVSIDYSANQSNKTNNVSQTNLNRDFTLTKSANSVSSIHSAINEDKTTSRQNTFVSGEPHHKSKAGSLSFLQGSQTGSVNVYNDFTNWQIKQEPGTSNSMRFSNPYSEENQRVSTMKASQKTDKRVLFESTNTKMTQSEGPARKKLSNVQMSSMVLSSQSSVEVKQEPVMTGYENHERVIDLGFIDLTEEY